MVTFGGSQKERTGLGPDIDTSGIFFETDKACSFRQTIRLSVGFKDAAIQCDGPVVRVEKLEDKFRVAAELTWCVFR